MTPTVTSADVTHALRDLTIPTWAPVCALVGLLLVLAAFAIDAWRWQRTLCPVHLARGLHVTMAGSERGAPYCPLCLFPEVKR